MKRILGEVVENNDTDQEKKIKANLKGLTDNIPPDALPWAVPMGEFCNVPNIGDKVWVYVQQHKDSEGFDFSYQWYENFTEETYKECFDMTASESYKTKNQQRLLGSEVEEPEIEDSVEYPTNRVFKISNITIEFDEGNERWCLTDTHGNYLLFNDSGFVEKSIGDKHEIIDGNKNTFVNGDITTEDSHGNKLKTSGTQILLEDSNGKKIEIGSLGIEINSGGSVESMVLGQSLVTWLATFITSTFNTHTHITTAPLIPAPTAASTTPPLPVGSAPTGTEFLSTKNKND